MEDQQERSFSRLQREVVSVGLCQGCGACSGFCPTSALTHDGDECEPVLTGECVSCGICSEVCGGRSVRLPELERAVFGRTRDLSHPFEYWLGIYKSCLAGYAGDLDLRKSGASGGVASALVRFALDTKQIDVALLTGMDKSRPWRAAPIEATTLRDVQAAQQSKYQMAPTLTLLSDLAKRYGRIGVVGLPCQIWPIRKALNVPGARAVAEKVVLTIGLFCAAQYYYKATEHLVNEWCGVEDVESVVDLQYRGGEWPGSFIVKIASGKEWKFPQHDYKYHHLIPYYQRDRCTMCLDYSSDVADISVGDIWAISQPGDPGWNAILVRTDVGKAVMEKAESSGYLATRALDTELLLYGTMGVKSKLIANTYRYANRIRFGWPTPEYGYEPTGYRRPLIGKRSLWSK